MAGAELLNQMLYSIYRALPPNSPFFITPNYEAVSAIWLLCSSGRLIAPEELDLSMLPFRCDHGFSPASFPTSSPMLALEADARCQ